MPPSRAPTGDTAIAYQTDPFELLTAKDLVLLTDAVHGGRQIVALPPCGPATRGREALPSTSARVVAQPHQDVEIKGVVIAASMASTRCLLFNVVDAALGRG